MNSERSVCQCKRNQTSSKSAEEHSYIPVGRRCILASRYSVCRLVTENTVYRNVAGHI